MAGTFQTGCGELFSHLFKNPKARLCSKFQLLELRVYSPEKLAEFPPLVGLGGQLSPLARLTSPQVVSILSSTPAH